MPAPVWVCVSVTTITFAAANAVAPSPRAVPAPVAKPLLAVPTISVPVSMIRTISLAIIKFVTLSVPSVAVDAPKMV